MSAVLEDKEVKTYTRDNEREEYKVADAALVEEVSRRIIEKHIEAFRALANA